MTDRLEDLNDPNKRRDDDLDRATGRVGGEGGTADNAPVQGEAVGGVSGMAAGAAIGAVTGGPIGAVIGAAAGALTGIGVAKGVDAAVNHEEEDAYWRDNYNTRPYASADRTYDQYRPAYQYGWESRARLGNRSFDEAEPELASGWESYRGQSQTSLAWDDAKHATKDAWHRIERRLPGDADRDGR
jgi:hypothetical protein